MPASWAAVDDAAGRAAVLAALGTGPAGLSEEEAALRLKAVGPNRVAAEREQSALAAFFVHARNPLNFLLLALAAVSWLTGDARAAAVIALIVALSVVFGLRAGTSLQPCRRRPARHGEAPTPPWSAPARWREVPIETLVPGDVVRLSAGDMVPADAALLSSKDLHVNQSALTGESMPVEKSRGRARPVRRRTPLDLRQSLLHGQQRGQRQRAPRGHPAHRRRHLSSAQLAAGIGADRARADRIRPRHQRSSPG